jgi:cell division protease FtsH
LNQEFNSPNKFNKFPPDQESRLPGWGGANIIWLLIILILASWVWNLFGSNAGSATPIDYSTFRQQLRAGNVAQVTITGDRIEGSLIEPAPQPEAETETAEEEPPTFTEFITFLPSFGDDGLLPLLEANEVKLTTQPDTGFAWFNLLISFLPFFLLVGLVILFLSRMQARGQQILNIGRNKAKLYQRKAERTTFNDVAGSDGAKVELQEIVDYLKDPGRVQRLGGEPPKGVLLVGPPGTGKTLLARAVAGEADVPFFSISGSDFMEMFVGVGASRVRSLFEEAKKSAPSIIFIDEIDSVGRRRGAGLGGGHDEREQTLNQLLSELDGFEPNQSVIVMAATNRPDILDPALLRPGRFDRRIMVDLPTLAHRREILEIHARNKPLSRDIDLEQIARSVPGFSGADLKNMLNEAALLAARKDKLIIEAEDVELARDKILMGLEREGLALTDEERRLIAFHEAGHAVVAALVPHADPIHKVTVVPRGRAMGVTQQLPERDKYVYPQNYLLDRLAVMMGGRAAEQLEFETCTSGAENDLREATRLARKMVLDWGMSNWLGPIALGDGREEVFLGEEIANRRAYSEATAREVDQEIKAILENAYQRAAGILQEHQPALNSVAEALLAYEVITGQTVTELVGVKNVKEKTVSSNHNGRMWR